MKLKNPNAQIYIPDGVKDGISRTTHMAIGAHQDDLEIMAYEGISLCYESKDKWFCGVVVTNGAGSPRTGKYADFTDDEMQVIRKQEQNKAADIGKYCAMVQLDYPSKDVKDKDNQHVILEIKKLIETAEPETIYIHNLADKHDTHVATAIKVIKAIKMIPEEKQPKQLIGCEVWRGLDWLLSYDKLSMDASMHKELAEELLAVFDSQIAGGKRYDLAALGRRLANATFAESHAVDEADSVIYGMDLLPLIKDKDKNIAEYIQDYINRLNAEVIKKIAMYS
jgi:LmbE family N-acetylglucosaminyl deacetylase